MTGMTTKQAAAQVRKLLGNATGKALRWPDGYELSLPRGLRYGVRATRTGVNITIEDAGYVDQVTGGDREKFSKQEHGASVVEKIGELRGKLYDPPLPGETKWGLIVISVRATGVTHISSNGAETVPCDRCGAEIPKHGGTRYTLASANGIEELCGDCHRVEMTSAF